MEDVKKVKRINKPKLSIHERDKLFLAHAKTKGYVFDTINGIIYNKHGEVLGTRGKKTHMLFFMIDRQGSGLTRSRAIWLHVHGFVPENKMPSHISTDRFNDGISNLELKSTSERSKSCAVTRRGTRINRDTAKLTIELVNFARRVIRTRPNVSYTTLLKRVQEKIGKPISKPTLILAVQGRTFADAKEPPVIHKTILKKVPKTPTVRIRKPKNIEVIDKDTLLNMEISINTAKSMIKNNPNLSNKAIVRFLSMRNLSVLSFQRLTSIRNQILETKNG